ncbi:MAG TPA: sugar phosphate isomerase/epimerase family protein [Chloroflexota bacterium]|nr:sugar phosphate isomerase/epimerase family protein [Chloroflexota bacterium]
MRLGVCGGKLPANMDDLSPELCHEVRQLGYSGIFTRFRANDPLTTTREQCRRARAVIEDSGLRLYQTTGYWQCLIHPDESKRAEAVKVLQASLKIAGWLGARSIDTGPGSLNPRGPWFPHPDNWTPLARRQLIRSLREAAPAAEDAGVYLGLEAHQLVTLSSPEVTRDVLDAVDSPWVRCDLDPANWITLETAFNTGPAIDHMFDVLGDRIVSGHAKDSTILDKLTIHIDACCPGTGNLDFGTYFRRMEALNPEYPLIVEGASYEQWGVAAEFLHGVARKEGIRVIE